MANLYIEFKKQHEKRVNDFPMHFAFGNGRLSEKLNELGVTENDIVGIGCGGFIKKTDIPAYKALNESYDQELKEKYKNDQFVYDMFYYELGNHEFGYTGDLEPAINACGLTFKELFDNERLNQIMDQAKSNFIKNNQDNW